MNSDPERRGEGAERGGVDGDGSGCDGGVCVVQTPDCAADSVNLRNNYRSPGSGLEVGNVQIIA